MNFLSSIPKPSLYILAIASAALFSCNDESSNSTTTTDTTRVSADTTQHSMPMPDTAAVAMVGHAQANITGTYPDTAVSGSVKFDADSASGKVKMLLEISVPAKAGKNVAVHLHEHGDCGDMGKMAHGHWNPTNAQHGKWGSGSFHSGDIGNVKLNSKGNGSLTISTDLWTLGGKPDKNILGKSVIVHGGVDDFTTQPTGNAGTRIGCGVVQ